MDSINLCSKDLEQRYIYSQKLHKQAPLSKLQLLDDKQLSWRPAIKIRKTLGYHIRSGNQIWQIFLGKTVVS